MIKTFIILSLTLVTSIQGIAMTNKNISDLKWLSGAWRGKASWGQPVDLVISQLNGNRILASETIFKDAKDRKISSYEHIEIRQSKNGLELEVFPKDQKSLIMKATLVSIKKAVFENPQHDFPKYWSFEILSDGKLKEFASGDKNKVEIIFDKVKK